MTSLIVVHPIFDGIWPFAADEARAIWMTEGEVLFHRQVFEKEKSLVECFGLESLKKVSRALILDSHFTEKDLASLPALREAALQNHPDRESLKQILESKNIKVITHANEGFWGQSVAEFGLALTLGALRRIPQTYLEMKYSLAVWRYEPESGKGLPGERGQQYGDDPLFVNGTLEGKRVRVVGMGNIGSRYAQWAASMGAEVAAWDPAASDPVFHRTGVRRVFRLEELFHDADIVVPMMPLLPATEGIVTGGMIRKIPKGALMVLVTRAGIVDTKALRERVVNGELALAADVFDVEPVPLNDPLLGLPHVVHTPHNAGRTREANRTWAEKLLAQFSV